MTRPEFATAILGTTDEYRLDIVTDPEPDIPQVVSYFTASDPEAASQQALRLLAAVNGPDDRYGELYTHDGDGGAVHVDTIHLPE
ncbi:hypothetical protein JNW91_26870 [Micromonospora sp. STR1_7]|uniref:Halobacterial output domain-containing protein n=1 Tax=Micromonospora parastrephiae TaxID=2806101 RepID=A0ABS1Y0Q8_9ACTN|nr:hypothetical protein [Micromonospora parastrephiae]MBM0235106.1 hypothetical protein [Micromonospora parastrephiae]